MDGLEDLLALDALDAEQRALRREQLKHWTRLQKTDAARARAVLDDPNATAGQKLEARILIGAYAISPGLMMASGGIRGVGTRDIERHNRHARVPPLQALDDGS